MAARLITRRLATAIYIGSAYRSKLGHFSHSATIVSLTGPDCCTNSPQVGHCLVTVYLFEFVAVYAVSLHLQYRPQV